jgi:riboflavin kinase/FMN adenylyltransferase
MLVNPSFRVYHCLEDAVDFGPCALTIGNFDGVHAGHRQILECVIQAARASGWKSAVLTFSPHPATIVAPARAPKLLSSTAQRAAWMCDAGIEQVLILPFTRQLSELSAEDFVRGILVQSLDARAVFIGSNFRFGFRQSGDAQMLVELGKRCGFTTEIIDAVSLRRHPISSTAIRRLINSGNVSLAARMLGRPHFLEGNIVPGRGIGSKHTVPTLNLAAESEVIPATGVYITRTVDLNAPHAWRSITNVGYRPTFGESAELSVETYLLSPLEGHRPGRIRIEFLRCLRAERKFDSPEALKIQILADIRRTETWFRRSRYTGT